MTTDDQTLDIIERSRASLMCLLPAAAASEVTEEEINAAIVDTGLHLDAADACLSRRVRAEGRWLPATLGLWIQALVKIELVDVMIGSVGWQGDEATIEARVEAEFDGRIERTLVLADKGLRDLLLQSAICSYRGDA